MKYSIHWLQSQIENEVSIDYLFFWGHTQNKLNEVGKFCFSQWHESAFVVNGIKYLTAEHWMMAQKALLFNDDEKYQKIIDTPKAAIAKNLGREVKNFDAVLWNERAYKIVIEGNFYKFRQNQKLQQFLLSTGKQVLVEASPVDCIWGIGLAQNDIQASSPFEWKGTNLLGFALMEVRDLLNE
ncbi:MAG: NADAR family protein [Chitinophagaceae bacterium]